MQINVVIIYSHSAVLAHNSQEGPRNELILLPQLQM